MTTLGTYTVPALIVAYLATVSISLENSCRGCGERAQYLKNLFVGLLVLSLLFISGQTIYALRETTWNGILGTVVLAAIPALIVSALAYTLADDCETCDTNGKAIKSSFLAVLVTSVVVVALGGHAWLYLKYHPYA